MRYKGSHFQMMCEGECKYYNTFKISNDMESKWLGEMQSENLNSLDNTLNLQYDDSKICWDYGELKLQRVISVIQYVSIQGKYIYAETYTDRRICYYYN